MALLGIGVDSCSHKRVAELQQKWEDKLATRVLTPTELEQAESSAKYLAGNFALKEAVAKALGTGIGKELSFQDIEIGRPRNARPQITLSTQVQEKFNVGEIHCSLTHEEDLSTAFVVLEKA
jgi:holo-[acyl-carrier protein] synthase